MDLTQSWNDAVGAIITFLPKFALFLVILLIGWLVAKALRKIVDVVLTRVGFDRAVERGGVRRALEQSKYDASGLIAALVYYAVLLIALQFAFGVFGPNPVSALLAAIVGWLPRAVVAIVIVVVAAAIANALRDLVGSALSALSYGQLVAKVVQIFVIALGVIAALNQIGVATAVTTPVLVAVLATVGGVIVVGMGGGMIRPMQRRWERWLDRAEDDFPTARSREEAYARGREDAQRSQWQREPSESSRAAGMTGGLLGDQSRMGEQSRTGDSGRTGDPGRPLTPPPPRGDSPST
jgi:mechanosensitive ion channel-like protein